MKKILKAIAYLVGFLALIFLGFIAVMWATEWKPAEIEPQSTEGLAADVITKDTLKIVSWNIGYAGLGDDMDFFYDGGSSVQCSEQRTVENLNAIIAFLRQHDDADFILLQEVDFDSKRSYHMNEYDSICAAMPQYMGWSGLNYVSGFVPIPVTDPIGKVKSGVVILSRYAPIEVLRLQYPGGFGFPTRIFNLKRCLLTASFRLDDSDTPLYISTTHNTAYDTGGMRSGEMSFLRSYLNGKPLAVTAGDWNSNPPSYTPSRRELDDAHFSPLPLKAADFPSDWIFLADTSTYSTRYGYEPYNPATTTRTILDFALLGSGISPLEVQTVDLGFKNSDHNPVVMKLRVKN